MSTPENIRERLAEALLCQCGHDIGGEHNTNGCYATVDYGQRTQRSCDCTRTDDQDPLDALLPFIDTLLHEQREGIAAEIEALPGPGEVGIKGWPECDQEIYLLAVEEAATSARTFGGER